MARTRVLVGQPAVTSLESLLAEARLDSNQRGIVRRAAAHGAAWTTTTTPRLLELGLAPPAAVEGRVLLLAEHQARGSVWSLVEGALDVDAGDVSLAGSAMDAWVKARRVAHRFLPVASEALDPHVQGLWHGRLVACDRYPPTHLSGESFGLPFVLDEWSRQAHISIPVTVAATGKVRANGDVVHVDGLQQKIEALRDWCPAVTRLLVPAHDINEAEKLRHSRHPALSIVPIANVDDAVCATWGNTLLRLLEQRWQHDARSRALATRRLFTVAVIDEGAHIRWEAVCAAAEIVARHGDDDERWRAGVASAVASRKAGTPTRLPRDPPREQSLTPTQQLAVHSSDLMALADLDVADWTTHAAAARRVLAGREDRAEERRVRFALGWLLAANGAHGEAATEFRATLDGWNRDDALHRASQPACALLRVLPLVPSADIASAARLALECLADPRTPATSRCYLRAALGRAYTVVGAPVQAREHLAESAAPWNSAPHHLRASVHRFRWRAGLDPARALHELDDIVGNDPAETEWAAWLHRVDRGERPDLADAPLLVRNHAARIVRARGGLDYKLIADSFPY